MSNLKNEEKWIKHYSNYHTILLVGEGDFSFAACLATAFGSANNITATSFDSQDAVIRTFCNASTNLRRLEEMGCRVLHDVDAHTMSTDTRLWLESFDRIVFNFPHAGFIYREHNWLQIELHQNLVKGFFRSACDMVATNGEVHVTHKTAYPFCKWEIKMLAEDVGLRLVKEARFSRYDYPGYINKRGSGLKSNKTFPVGECSTFIFKK